MTIEINAVKWSNKGKWYKNWIDQTRVVFSSAIWHLYREYQWIMIESNMMWRMNRFRENYIRWFFSVRIVSLEMIVEMKMVWLENHLHKNLVQCNSVTFSESGKFDGNWKLMKKVISSNKTFLQLLYFLRRKSHRNCENNCRWHEKWTFDIRMVFDYLCHFTTKDETNILSLQIVWWMFGYEECLILQWGCCWREVSIDLFER